MIALAPGCHALAGQADLRVIVRGLHCVEGTATCELDLKGGCDFQARGISVAEYTSGFSIDLPKGSLRLWTSHTPAGGASRPHSEFSLREGEEFWAVLEWDVAGHGWSSEAARHALAQVEQHWGGWVNNLRPAGRDDPGLRRTAMIVHLLSYAPEGSVVAAPATSLPERIGGGWNVDYRLCWVRGASRSVGILARLGNLRETEGYRGWLRRRLSLFGQLPHVPGYRSSPPVRVGNHAYKQHQLGAYGYLADCVWTYLQEGGAWQEDYWRLIHRLANYAARHWRRPKNGIWELPELRHYLNSKVLSWVMLDRAARIAREVNPAFNLSAWEATRETIHAEVITKGWSESLGAFRQHYGSESLDAASLLIPVMDFLPPDHPRVLATIARAAERLGINQLVCRFDPLPMPGLRRFPLGELEGAFFPSTFWLATVYAKTGQLERAEEILAKAEKLAGPLELFSEAADPRSGAFLGNAPLFFSHVEYARAELEIARVRGGAGGIAEPC